ncbi:MAG: hypothetical protein PHE33_07140 [Bacteroidales bacterium]|nr:hypothetical protein [Bacteroidales bacterium]
MYYTRIINRRELGLKHLVFDNKMQVTDDNPEEKNGRILKK